MQRLELRPRLVSREKLHGPVQNCHLLFPIQMADDLVLCFSVGGGPNGFVKLCLAEMSIRRFSRNDSVIDGLLDCGIYLVDIVLGFLKFDLPVFLSVEIPLGFDEQMLQIVASDDFY
jgi:hypothetical protein